MDDVLITTGFAESERVRVGAVYWVAFAGKLGPAFPGRTSGRRIVARALRPDRMLVARAGRDVMRVCGLHHDGRGVLDLSWRLLRRDLGPMAALRASALPAVLDRPERPGALVLDGVAVAAGHRGRGIGTALLDAADRLARDRGDRAVRLSVVDADPRAEALYRRLGFGVVGAGSIGPLARVYGFRRYRTMEREVVPA